MKKILFISMLLISGLVVNAQCDSNLLKKAKSELKENETFIKDFKVKLKEADINDPAPVAKFYPHLEKGHRYILRIVSDEKEFNSVGIMRLYDTGKLLATNYDQQNNKAYQKFEFRCNSTGDYPLFITFQEGQEGCAVVIVSEIK